MGIGPRDRRGKWALWLGTGVLVLVLLGGAAAWTLTAGADDAPAPAATVAADRGPVTAEVATTGTVQPAQTRSLSFAAAGTVESVSVRPGTVVTKGQVLARIGDDDARDAVTDAQEALADADDALAEAKESAADADADAGTAAAGCVAAAGAVSTGSVVRAAYPSGVPVTTTSTGPTGPATTVPATPTTRAPTTRPTVPGPTTKAPAPAPTRPATTAPGGGRGGAPAATGCATQAPATGGGAQGGGAQGGVGTDAVLTAQQRVTQAGVALDQARETLDGTAITAPIAGRVLSVTGGVGTQVAAGAMVVSLADIYDMQISADFPEADADRLAEKQLAAVTLADRSVDPLQATVIQVDPVGTSDGTMVRYGVVLSFDESPEGLLVGQSAAVRVTTGSADDVLRVPATAVRDIAGDTGAVQVPDGTGTRRVAVGVGLRGDAYVEITSGLTAGETVLRSW